MLLTEQAHLRILKIVEAETSITQRQLAERLGVSLGKTNYLLKSLFEKGYIKTGNFLRAENKFKYAYLLTPAGIAARLQLTRDYLARKELEYVSLKAEIEAMRDELHSEDGHKTYPGSARNKQEKTTGQPDKHLGTGW